MSDNNPINPDQPIEDEVAEPPRQDSPAGEPALSRRLLAGLVVLLVASLVFGGLQWRRSAGLSSEAHDREQVATVAADLGVALLSYDYTDLEASRTEILRLTTDEFGRSYDETLEAGLEQIITSLEAVAEATVQQVFVGEINGDRAKAIAVFDSEVRSQAGVRRLEGSYLEMELVRRDGTWRVSAVTAVAAAGDDLDAPDPIAPPEPED